MNHKIPAHVLAFSKESGLEALFDAFRDYWLSYLNVNQGTKHEVFSVDAEGKPLNFDAKELVVNQMLRAAIVKRSGVPYAATMPVEQWFSHPVVQYETFAIVSMLVDMILPQSIIDSIGAYTDVRVIGWGDSAAFDIKPRDLFVVSKSGRGQRSTEMFKQFVGQKTIVPEFHEISVYVSLYRVLTGAESLAEFTAKAVKSMEVEITKDAYSAFATAMAALSDSPANTALRIAGYTQTALVTLAQKVGAWNNGAKPVVMGTQLALQNVLPTDANYRYDLESPYAKIGYIPTAFGYDLMMLPQVADWTTPFATLLDDAKLWIVSPGSQKLVKLVLEGNTLSNTTQPFQMANLTQATTLWKSWAAAVCTNSVAATITLS